MPPHVILVDDDDRFRQSLGDELEGEGYMVTGFSAGASAIEHLVDGGGGDILLLDWRMPDMDGLEVLRSLRRLGDTTPVIFLTASREDAHEEAALDGGAVDFIDKSRRLPILVKRLQRVADGARTPPESAGAALGSELRLGRLELRFDIGRASWSGTPLDLTPAEFQIVELLARRAGADVPYLELGALVFGPEARARNVDGIYRENVRVVIKRIRGKFRDLDRDFDNIRNYAGFGYSWRPSGV